VASGKRQAASGKRQAASGKWQAAADLKKIKFLQNTPHNF
jgi:hypothetical protein